MNHYIAKSHEIEPLRSGAQTLLAVVVKPQPKLELFYNGNLEGKVYIYRHSDRHDGVGIPQMARFAPYQPGQLIAVKETWAADLTSKPLIYAYKSDTPDKWFDYPQYIVWKSPVTMPLAAVRLHQRVGAVSVVRVQDVSVSAIYELGVGGTYGETGKWLGFPGPNHEWDNMNAQEAFAWHFNNLHGPGAWDANPFLFLIQVTPETKP